MSKDRLYGGFTTEPEEPRRTVPRVLHRNRVLISTIRPTEPLSPQRSKEVRILLQEKETLFIRRIPSIKF